MCYQEAALYGDLVLFLRDRAAELLAGDGDVEAQRAQLDSLIREWFFAPQEELHGCAPRDLIWAEQKGEPNPIPSERLEEFFFDDCSLCQYVREELEADLAAGVDPGFHWRYDDGGYPLIAQYDPEGWDARWAAEDAAFKTVSETSAQQEALIEQVNQLLDEDEWYTASEVAYNALWLVPPNFRAANALLRCYLHRDALREMERMQFRMFHPEDPDYDALHQRRRRLTYTYRGLRQAPVWETWLGSDRWAPPDLDDVAETLHAGFSALNVAYCVGEEGAYERARATFATAESHCADRAALYWYLARLYADYGFFAESLEALAQLNAVGDDAIPLEAQQLRAEVAWWQEYGEQLPWMH